MFIRISGEGRVAVITLDDEKRRNAITRGLVTELGAAFDELEADDGVGAVVITGAGSSFCAGADIEFLGKTADETEGARGDTGRSVATERTAMMAARNEFLYSVYGTFVRISRSTLPTIAAINGCAVGAGNNVHLACDVRLAARSATFDSRFLKLGLHPGGGHTWLLHQAIGDQGARALALFGEVIDGPRAAEIGLVWRCVEDDELLSRAVEMAARVADEPKQFVARIKESLDVAHRHEDHREAVDYEYVPQAWSMEQDFFVEGIRRLEARVLGPPR